MYSYGILQKYMIQLQEKKIPQDAKELPMNPFEWHMNIILSIK